MGCLLSVRSWRTICNLAVLLMAGRATAAPIDVYILAGQSNMGDGAVVSYAQEGQTIYVVDQQTRSGQQGIYQYLLADGGPIRETTNWQPMRPSGNFFGPELTFADAIEQRGSPAAFVKMAFNGTNLHSRWNPTSGDLYPMLIDKVQGALSQLVGYEPRIAAFLWVQGEGDATTLPNATAYGDRLLNLADRLRTDLNAPEAPFVFNQAHIDLNRAFTAELRQSQQTASQSPLMRMFNIDDLILRSDSVHFDAYAHAEVGRRMADALIPHGDFNDDRVVDSTDLAQWLGLAGDANADRAVDGTDFLAWQRSLTPSPLPAALPATASVPEPATNLMAVLMTIAVTQRKRFVCNKTLSAKFMGRLLRSSCNSARRGVTG